MISTAALKNQLRWRCRRGMQELDILLLNFLDHRFDDTSIEQQQAFISLLEQQDDVLWDWLSGQQVSTDKATSLLIKQLMPAAD